MPEILLDFQNHNYNVSPRVFDENMIFITPASIYNATVNGQNISLVTSQFYYLGQDGAKNEIYVTAPTQTGYAPTRAYKYLSAIKDLSTFEGYQLSYPFSASSSPLTTAEAEWWRFNQVMNEKLIQACLFEVNRSKEPGAKVIIPDTQLMSLEMFGVQQKNWTKIVKPTWSYPNKSKEDKTPDPTKPKRMFSLTSGNTEGGRYNCESNFFDITSGGSVKVDPSNLIKTNQKGEEMGVKIEMTPVFKVHRIFWGSHGSKTAYVVSYKFLLKELVFKLAPSSGGFANKTFSVLPKADTSVPTLSASDYQSLLQGASFEGEENEGEEGIEGDGGSSQTPADQLSALTAQVQNASLTQSQPSQVPQPINLVKRTLAKKT